MNLPALTCATAAVVSLLLALMTARLSVGPGWRELRWFSAAALLAALYAAGDLIIAVAPPQSALPISVSRTQLFFGGMHGVRWFLYTVTWEKRPLTRAERGVVWAGVVLGAASLVPGLAFSGAISERWVPLAQHLYRDAVPTAFGYVVLAYYVVAIIWLALHHTRRALRGEPHATAHAVGMGALGLLAIHDTLASASIVHTPYLLDVGYLAVVVAVAVAITQRFVESARALEDSSRELRATQAELVRRERLAALGELSAVVAHEVRNPVGVIWNAVSTLRKRVPGDPELQQLLGMVEEEGDRLRRIVDDLLALVRPKDLRREPVPLAALVGAASESARSGLAARAEQLQLALDPGLPPLSCDPRLLRQAVVNLVANALQAAPGGTVRVSLRHEGGFACIAVADDGPGVPTELRARLFTPFFTTRAQGTGLGLAIVRRVADAHGGEARLLEGATGQGATFVLRLPLEPPAAAARSA